jgi:hypothetical protein
LLLGVILSLHFFVRGSERWAQLFRILRMPQQLEMGFGETLRLSWLGRSRVSRVPRNYSMATYSEVKYHRVPGTLIHCCSYEDSGVVAQAMDFAGSAFSRENHESASTVLRPARRRRTVRRSAIAVVIFAAVCIFIVFFRFSNRHDKDPLDSQSEHLIETVDDRTRQVEALNTLEFFRNQPVTPLDRSVLRGVPMRSNVSAEDYEIYDREVNRLEEAARILPRSWEQLVVQLQDAVFTSGRFHYLENEDGTFRQPVSRAAVQQVVADFSERSLSVLFQMYLFVPSDIYQYRRVFKVSSNLGLKLARQALSYPEREVVRTLSTLTSKDLLDTVRDGAFTHIILVGHLNQGSIVLLDGSQASIVNIIKAAERARKTCVIVASDRATVGIHNPGRGPVPGEESVTGSLPSFDVRTASNEQPVFGWATGMAREIVWFVKSKPTSALSLYGHLEAAQVQKQRSKVAVLCVSSQASGGTLACPGALVYLPSSEKRGPKLE